MGRSQRGPFNRWVERPRLFQARDVPAGAPLERPGFGHSMLSSEPPMEATSLLRWAAIGRWWSAARLMPLAITIAPFGVITADAAAMVFSARMCRPEDRCQRVENSAAALVPSSLGKRLQTAAYSKLTADRREQCPMACRRQHATPATPAIATAGATFGGRGSESGEEGHNGLVRGWPCADERGDIGSSSPLYASVATRAQVRRLTQMHHERDAQGLRILLARGVECRGDQRRDELR